MMGNFRDESLKSKLKQSMALLVDTQTQQPIENTLRNSFQTYNVALAQK